MKHSIKLFDFMKTPVYLSYWFFLLIFLLNFNVNLIASVFVAVLVHEMAHTYAALKLKHYVSMITVGLFSGGAGVDTTYMNYKDVILIVGAGPLSNLILAGIGYLGMHVGLPTFLEILSRDFLMVNTLLFIYNILPIFPLDGGRISKAICQWLTKPTIGRKINGVIGIITSILLGIFSAVTGQIIIVLFSVFAIYLNYKEFTQKY